jgi:hypothetical protein
MTLDTRVTDFMRVLKADTTITSYVTASNIKLGYDTSTIDYPMIAIVPPVDNSVGRFGSKVASAGNRASDVNGTFQVEIYCDLPNGGARKCGLISDAIKSCLLTTSVSGCKAFRKTSGPFYMDDETHVWRMVERWNYTNIDYE